MDMYSCAIDLSFDQWLVYSGQLSNSYDNLNWYRRFPPEVTGVSTWVCMICSNDLSPYLEYVVTTWVYGCHLEFVGITGLVEYVMITQIYGLICSM